MSGFTISEIEPRLFSFNNPFGACPECGGLGVEQQIDADLVIPDKDATLAQGRDRAVVALVARRTTCRRSTRSASTTGSRSTPSGRTCGKKTQDAILYGSGDDEIKFTYDDGMRAYQTKKPFEGVITNLERRYEETESEWAREELQKYFTDIPCEACNGFRLKPEALCVKIAGKHIGEVSEHVGQSAPASGSPSCPSG